MPITLCKPFRDIQRWEPFQEIESLQSEMNRLFERLMPSGGNSGATGITF